MKGMTGTKGNTQTKGTKGLTGTKGIARMKFFVCLFLLLMIVCCFSFVRYYDGDVAGGGDGSGVFFCSLLVHCLWS